MLGGGARVGCQIVLRRGFWTLVPCSMFHAPCRALPVVHVLVDRVNRVGSDRILGRSGESL
jgi:hypothetical protein